MQNIRREQKSPDCTLNLIEMYNVADRETGYIYTNIFMILYQINLLSRMKIE